MKIYKLRQTVSTSGATGSQNTLPIVGGLMRQLYIIAATAGVTFRADLTDENSDVVRSYDFHKTEINDTPVGPLPVSGIYTIRVTNASADGQFTVKMMVQE